MSTERCFAESKKGKKCRALECRKCIGHKKCSFYETKERHKENRQKVYARLRTLPIEQQIHISLKYYNGECPWNEQRHNEQDE